MQDTDTDSVQLPTQNEGAWDVSPDRSRNPLEGVEWEGRVSPSRRHAELDVMCSMSQAGRVTVCIFRSFHRSATPPAPGCLPTRCRRREAMRKA